MNGSGIIEGQTAPNSQNATPEVGRGDVPHTPGAPESGSESTNPNGSPAALDGRRGRLSRDGRGRTVHASGSAPPKVAVVCRLLWNGGVQRVAIAQTEGLRQRGYDCRLIFLRRTENASYDLPSGTTILLGNGNPRRRRAPQIWAKITEIYAGHRGKEATVDVDLLWALRHELASYDAVIYSDQYTALLGIYLRISKRQPYILVFHEFYPKVRRPRFGRLLFALADTFDVFSALSASAIVTTSARNLSRLVAIRPLNVFLARIGCPPVVTADRSELGSSRRNVLSLSVWDEGRHPEIYLEIARRNPDFQFIIAGSWTDPELLEAFRKKCSELKNVQVTGVLLEQQRLQLLSDCLIYMRFGFGEAGPGMGGLEALAFGDIVLANLGLGISEVISQGVDGFVVAEPLIESTTDTLGKISRLTDDELKAISSQAKVLCAQLSWDSHTQTLCHVLEGLGVRNPTDPYT
jgi:glycosyltransferase involved in cell wall biosynthesis